MSSKRTLTYKTYCGSYEVDFDEGILFGKIECINDLVTFEAESVSELKVAFEEAVDDYLETCSNIGKDPDKPFKGSFNVRIGEGLHKKSYLEALKRNMSLNDFVKTAIEGELNNTERPNVILTFNMNNPDGPSKVEHSLPRLMKGKWQNKQPIPVH